MSPDNKNPPLLEINDLHIQLPGGADRTYAVEGLSLSVNRDEILCLVGESGSGKSMTAKAVLGLLPPRVDIAMGQINFKGEDVTKVTPRRLRQIRGSEISMVFQEPMTALNPLMTVGRQIEELIVAHAKLSAKERRTRILELIESVHLPNPERIIDSYPHELSGGQRQRAMIAMALILEPEMLIADEPTTALDVTTQAQILKLIKELQAKHRTGVLYITHDFGVVADIADRIAVMQHGKLVEIGTADEILNTPRHPYTRSLIAAVPGMEPVTVRPVLTEEKVLQISGLGKTFHARTKLLGPKSSKNDVRAVHDISLDLRKGETLGIVGESGSGKSTLARLITRVIQPDAGSVLYNGIDLLSLSRKEMRPYRKHIQMIFQDPYGSLNPRYKVGRLIAEGAMVHGMSRDAAFTRAREMLALVNLEPSAMDRYPHEFSGGQRQRIGIARALILEPSVIVADEPVSALDVSVQAQVLDLLTEIRERLSLSMIFITHDLRVAAQLCDTVVVMSKGEVVEYGTAKDVFFEPQHPYTMYLLESVPGKAWKVPDLGQPNHP